ncbi:MAG: hypothetical protein M3Z25_23165 [Actinomycetota bacterium]|nr:hypothetical protein [Actinomycetota bacterium]
MTTIVLLVAVAAGAYWVGARRHPSGDEDPVLVGRSRRSDEEAVPDEVDAPAGRSRPHRTYGGRRSGWWVVGMVVIAVLLLGLFGGPGLLGGPDLFGGPGPWGGPGGLFGP